MSDIAFLLGAGSSIPADFSSTTAITDRIREQARRRRGQSYRPLVVDWLIQKLFDLTDEYFAARRDESKTVNYEDVYYLASQIADDPTELQNPALAPLVVRLAYELRANRDYQRECDRDPTLSDPNALYSLCGEVCSRIVDVVRDALSRESAGANEHLDLIKAVHDADDLHLQGIGTLAHDTHAEMQLRSLGVPLSDGFGVPDPANELRLWRNCFPTGCVPFLKLHGSVNWFGLKGWPDGEAPASTVGMKDGVSIEHGDIPGPGENPVEIHGGTYKVTSGSMIIGTFNKPARYSSGVMLDSHYRFRRVLSKITTLVVCGYSFGDKGINTHIAEWYGVGRRVVVIDPSDRLDVIQTARGAACRILVEPTTQFITKKMQAVQPEELLELLRSRRVQPQGGRRYVVKTASKSFMWPLALSCRLYTSPQDAVEAAVLCSPGLPIGRRIAECPVEMAEFVAYPRNEPEDRTGFWIE